jgi:ribosomal protein S18 acetylase RimI-like enzyme
MVELKVAESKDIDLIIKLSDKIWRKHFPGIISDEQIDYMLGKMYSHQQIEKEMNEGVIWKIIYFSDKPAGYISYSMLNEYQCKLHKIYLLPSLQRKGIGRISLNDVMDYAKDKKAMEIILNVNRNNLTAIKAYEKYGFMKIKEEDVDFDKKFILNDYVMGMSI